MSEHFTSQTAVDRDTILTTCNLAVRDGGLRFLEIGVFYGATATGIKKWCETHGFKLEYFGCDDFSHPNFTMKPFSGAASDVWPFDGAWVRNGASWDLHHHFPDNIDIVFVDGNHSGNAVILDTALYAQKVRKGGYMMFHDTAPHIQQTMPEQNAPDHSWWRNSVNAAHDLIGWPWTGWKLISDAYDADANFGGIRVYQKL